MNAKVKRLVLTSLMFALALILSVIESMFPITNVAVGIKLGLSNIVVMFTLLYIDAYSAVLVVVLKSLFATVARGMVAGVLSLFGGGVSLLSIIVVLMLVGKRRNFVVISAIGALFHNLGQLFVAVFIVERKLVLLLPALGIAGVIFGVVTGIAFSVIIPRLKGLTILHIRK